MARSAILSNGRLAVGLNTSGFVHDFYYPYVGQENLTTARSTRHRIGIWIDNEFSWLDSDQWQHKVTLSHESLETETVMKSEKYRLEVRSIDFVDHELDAFCRIITVHNSTDQQRSIRLFMHQIFELSSDGRGDTALYIPEEHYILTYKGRTCLLASGKVGDDSFDQHAVGSYGIEGKKGTYVDAEDGELSGSNVEHGGVDSVIRFSANVEPSSKTKIEYWVASGASPKICEEIHSELQNGLLHRQSINREYWKSWLAPASRKFELLPENQRILALTSLLTIKAHIDSRGGIIASCDSSIYNYGRDYYSYVWPRDGAYAIRPLIRLGYKDEPEAFFKFCTDVAHRSGYVMHKYSPDRSIGSTWHPRVQDGKPELAIQEDETAVAIYMLAEYLEYSGNEQFVSDIFERFVIKGANFLANFCDESTGLPHASYDLWEEKFITSTYTSATVYGALMTASELAKRFGHTEFTESWLKTAEKLKTNFSVFIHPEGYLRKGFRITNNADQLIFDDTVDVSSLFGSFTFNFYSEKNQSCLASTAEKIESILVTQNGGVARHSNDHYFKRESEKHPNPWHVTTLWLAQYYIRTNNLDRAQELIKWSEEHSLDGVILSEQVHPVTDELISVTPLVWSHAEYINTLLDYYQRKK